MSDFFQNYSVILNSFLNKTFEFLSLTINTALISLTIMFLKITQGNVEKFLTQSTSQYLTKQPNINFFFLLMYFHNTLVNNNNKIKRLPILFFSFLCTKI